MKQSSTLRSGIRVPSLDAWRGLAALMVVTLHTIVPAILGPYPELQSVPFYRHVALGNYGVQIFFVVSGLCVAQAALRSLNKPAPLSAFVMARVRRIYPPYVIASVLAVLVSAVAAGLVAWHLLPNSSLGSEKLFARPFFDYACSAFLLQRACGVTPLLPVFWTLCYEAAFYALVAGALSAAFTFGRDRLVLDLCHVLTLICSLALLVSPNVVPYPFDLWPEFGLGVLALDILTLQRPIAYVVLVATIILQLVYASTHFGGSINYLPTAGMEAVTAVAFCMVLLTLNRIDNKVARLLPVRALSYVGVFSYSLYLLHWLVIGPVAQVLRLLHLVSASNYWISVLAQVGVAILAARLFYVFAERPFLSARRSRTKPEAAVSSVPASLPVIT